MAAGVRLATRESTWLLCRFASLVIFAANDSAQGYRVHHGSSTNPAAKIKELQDHKVLFQANASAEADTNITSEQDLTLVDSSLLSTAGATDTMGSGSTSQVAPKARGVVAFEEVALKEEHVAASEQHSIQELLHAVVPHFPRQAGLGCFADIEESRIGCRGECRCLWYERCFPKHVLMLDGLDQQLLHVDIGTCSVSAAPMVVLSVSFFVLSIFFIVWIRMVLADKRETPPKRLPAQAYPVLTISPQTGIHSVANSYGTGSGSLRGRAMSTMSAMASRPAYPVLRADGGASFASSSSSSTDGSRGKQAPKQALLQARSVR